VVNEVLERCGGSQKNVTPVPTLKNCPGCGEEVEIWSDELKTKCGKCGITVTMEATPSCIDWCRAAKECLGEDNYNRMMKARGKNNQL
jgi:ribosomal protein S27AE